MPPLAVLPLRAAAICAPLAALQLPLPLRHGNSISMAAAAPPRAAALHTCAECTEAFASRNQLFKHLRVHALSAATAGQQDNGRELPPRMAPAPPPRHDQQWAWSPGALDIAIEEAHRHPEIYRVVVKPQGMETLTDGDGKTYPALTAQDALMIPSRWGNVRGACAKFKKARPCHRLDAGTGGLVLCAESKAAERAIKMGFHDRHVKKRYRALVVGRLEPREGSISRALKGKPSTTRYAVAAYTPSDRYGCVSTVDLWPVEGRNHQLRKHLQSVGHPIVGDRHYSFASTWPEDDGGWPPCQFLWALEMWFPDPGVLCEIAEAAANDDAAAVVAKREGEGALAGDGHSGGGTGAATAAATEWQRAIAAAPAALAESVRALRSKHLAAVSGAAGAAALEAARAAAVGKHGEVSLRMRRSELAKFAHGAERQSVGRALNAAKGEIGAALQAKEAALSPPPPGSSTGRPSCAPPPAREAPIVHVCIPEPALFERFRRAVGGQPD